MSERCFVSVELNDTSVQQRLEEVQGNLARYGQNKPTDPTQFHTTLNFIGELEKERIEGVKQRLRDVSFTPFKMNVKGIGAFPNEDFIKVLWAGIESDDLTSLADSVRAALPDDLVEDRAFHPHITLLRLHNISGEEKTQLQESIDRLREEEFGCIQADAFLLKRSILTENGAEHRTIAEYLANENR